MMRVCWIVGLYLSLDILNAQIQLHADDTYCSSLVTRYLGTSATYLTFEQFPLRQARDGLAVKYSHNGDTLWAIFDLFSEKDRPRLLEKEVWAWYPGNKNASPEAEIWFEKHRREPCSQIVEYRVWTLGEDGQMQIAWQARQFETLFSNPGCRSRKQIPCALLEESHSPQWMDLDKDGIPEWVDNIRLVHLKDPEKNITEEHHALQIWRWIGRNLRLTGMDLFL
ncbi:MAG: hypothetical protein NZM15_09795 [Flavobacteriales bacterium]|nr:hypothetical protein [Flavobacteriales bacterium]MDW8432976.1 hypothetical protein [Flavobacteriales bacterium]